MSKFRFRIVRNKYNTIGTGERASTEAKNVYLALRHTVELDDAQVVITHHHDGMTLDDGFMDVAVTCRPVFRVSALRQS